MEVAGQWRREWAGTAEYGKVTEGGVTRRVARALEVLHASGPGARVRVMRAAYHSSAGPGVPAASYMVHSSRRVISSGSNFLETPSSLTKPLEISSTPLDPVQIEENYKVTEPDDMDISEPSKWRVSTGKSSIRMPSEESSSTADNTSIIDLDLKTNHKNTFRKFSYDSENSDIQIPKTNARSSPLLDAPTTLSTLKYKSLLNSSNDWNNRRKSYSFEDTSPINETILHGNDIIAMESSTDSGICKSTEIVNENADCNTYSKYLGRLEQKQSKQEETFKSWLSKNKQNSFCKESQLKAYRKYHNDIDVPVESGITLQSTGKVSITLPVTVDDEYQYKKIHSTDDSDRKIKKVEFCKTELHFAADSGTVNIIETDEKPAPSNDFRRRRSAFVPMKEKFEKPITLFGEKVNNFNDISRFPEFPIGDRSEIGEFDENIAATKSILKNKIPKPKPYLLGENMIFGISDEQVNKTNSDNNLTVSPAVSLINKQLHTERRRSNESIASETDTSLIKRDTIRPTDIGPSKNGNSRERRIHVEVENNYGNNKKGDIYENGSVKYKLKVLQMSPVQSRPKTRELRESDLPYFGISNGRKNKNEIISQTKVETKVNGSIDDIFRSVKLIKEISNSVCNSETESEDNPQYQNLTKSNFDPIPPLRRLNHENSEMKNENIRILKPIIEQDIEISNANIIKDTRRSRSKKYEDTVFASRSLSEPPKIKRNKSLDSSVFRHQHLRLNDSQRSHRSKRFNNKESNSEVSDDSPLYANVNDEEIKTDQKKQTEKIPQTKINEICKNDRSSEDRKMEHGLNNKVKNTMHTNSIKGDKNSLHKKQSHLKKKDTNSTGKSMISDKNQHKTNYDKPEKTLSHNSNRAVENNTRGSRLSQNLKQAVGQEVRNSQGNQELKRITKKISETDKSKVQSRSSSQDQTSLSKERSGIQKSEINTKDRIDNFTEIKNKERNASLDKTSRQSEYVINYDDKNGTVSSVCKIKSSSGTSKRKKMPYDNVKIIPKEQIVKNRTSEKKFLLQLPEQQRNTNRLRYPDKKWRTKVHVQRSCQLL